MSLIKGIHHVSMKCESAEEYQKVISFYKEVLEIPVARQWSEGIMLDTGNGIIEIFNNGDKVVERGVIRHFAFATDSVDECVEKIKKAGYEVFVEPKDIEIQSNPTFPARIAFCYGSLGEEIELFQER
ncbi:VOC family protein [Eubacterium ventriosum]|uniref:VOC family protein n=1 Tax=Eubacterium ventriosum TaxID=39496 RepID=UPI00242A95C8|nr:VOC family protein [Eubacterium ventriosum]